MPKSGATERLRGLVDTLPRTERLIVLLFFADGLRADEIAEVMELPPGRVAEAIASFRGRAADCLVRRTAA